MTNVKEQYINRLDSIRNTFDVANKTIIHDKNDVISYQSPLKILTNILESNLQKEDDIHLDKIEILMKNCIELLKNEDKDHLLTTDNKISIIFNLLQEYNTTTIIPLQMNNKDSPSNQHVSSLIMTSSDISDNLTKVVKIPLMNSSKIINSFEKFEKNPIRSTELSSNMGLEPEQQLLISEYQDIVKSTQSLTTSYTGLNKKASKESLQQIVAYSQENNKTYVTSKSDLNDLLNEQPNTHKIELHDNSSDKQWLDSLLSKLSNSINEISSKCSTKSC